MHLRPRAETARLHFAEVAHLDTALEIRAGPQVRERADAHVVLERRALEHRRLDAAPLPHHAVPHDRVRADARAGPDLRTALEDAAAVDERVRGDLDVGVDAGGRRVDERDPVLHVPLADTLARDAVGEGEVRARVDSEALGRVLDAQRRDGAALVARDLHEVGEEHLAGLVRAQLRDGTAQPRQIGGVRTEVRFGDGALGRGREARLHDPVHVAARPADDAAVCVVGTGDPGEQREDGAPLVEQGLEPPQGLRAHEDGVAVDDPAAARPVGDGAERDADRVTGPAGRLLQRHRNARGHDRPRGLALLRQEHDRTRAGGGDGVEDVREQRLAGGLVKDLARRRAHPGAEPGGQDEGKACIRRVFAHGREGDPTPAGAAGSEPRSTAGAPGFEPGVGDPKSPALPLGHAPTDYARASPPRSLRRRSHVEQV